MERTVTGHDGTDVPAVDAQRQTIERQADTIHEQTEQVGELRATVVAQDASIATLVAPTSTEGPKPSRGAITTVLAFLGRLRWARHRRADVGDRAGGSARAPAVTEIGSATRPLTVRGFRSRRSQP